MNPKLLAFLVKGVVSLGFAVPIGLLVKLNYRIDEKIDEKYNPEKIEEDPAS